MIQQLGDAGIQMSRRVPAALVLLAVCGRDAGKGLTCVLLCRQGAGDKHRHAIAYEMTVTVHRMRWKAVSAQGGVTRVGDVLQRVQQRSIQVKENRFHTIAR